jgi:peptide/nickel transport system substrate-binding protein
MIGRTLSRRHFLHGAAVAGAAAVAGPKLGWSAEGGVFRMANYGDLQVLDPAFTLAAAENAIYELIYHRLVRFKGAESTEVEPDAAETINQVDDTHIEFTLKKGIMWSNDFGELTAEDVKYSYERIADPAMESPYSGNWAALDHVEVTGSHSGVIVLKEFSATLWTIALPGSSGYIVCKKAVEALPEKKYTTEAPALSGPYMIAEWTPKQRTILKPNPAWGGAKQAFDEFHVLPIEDASAAELAYEAGDIDFTRITLSTLGRYRKEGTPAGSKLIDMPSLAYVWVGMNVDNPALADVRVRKAIQRAVDVEGAVEAAYFGVATAATGIVADTLIGHRNQPPMQRDVEAAKALLAEAGVSDLTLTIDVGLETENLTIAQVVQASLAEIGINVVINQRDSATFWTLGDQSAGDQWKDMQLFLNRYSMDPDPSYATEWFTCEQVGVWNWERVCNPEFDKLHTAAKSEKDVAKRAEMYEKAQALMEDSGAYVFLTHERIGYIYRDKYNVAVNPAGEPLTGKFGNA